MRASLRWIGFCVVALAFGPVWHELVAQLYSRVFSGMPPSVLFRVDPRRLETIVACALTSLALALLLRRRIRAAQGLETGVVSGLFLLAAAALTPLVWWAVEMSGGVIEAGPAAFGEDTLVVTVYTPLVLVVSGLAWTMLIVWAAWPLAAIEVWLLGRILGGPRAGSGRAGVTPAGSSRPRARRAR
jgi:hypothetical protein